MRATAVAVALTTIACGESRTERPPPPPPAARPATAAETAPADLTEPATRLLRATGATGAIVAIDVATARVMASVAIGRDIEATLLPLSTIKLYLAALWWNHDMADRTLRDTRRGEVTAHDMLVEGYDRPGIEMAVALRTQLGAEPMLAELRVLGLGERPGTFTLPPGADDSAWGHTLSIGEDHVEVTVTQVARFLRAVGAGDPGMFRGDTARRLRDGMLGAVDHGTAAAVAPRLAGTGWKLGGKTGTGPDPVTHTVGPTSDGWFAGLAFKGDTPRLAIAVFVAGKGPGGEVAAGLAADLTRALAER